MVAGVFVTYLILATAWWNLGLPAGFDAAGVVLLDLRAGWGIADVQSLFVALGESGRASYRTFALLDMFYAIGTAVALGPLLAWPLERIRPGTPWARLPALVPWAAATLDVLENIGVLMLLDSWPSTDTSLPLWAGTITLFKMALVGLIPLTLVLSWLGYGVMKLIRKGS